MSRQLFGRLNTDVLLKPGRQDTEPGGFGIIYNKGKMSFPDSAFMWEGAPARSQALCQGYVHTLLVKPPNKPLQEVYYPHFKNKGMKARGGQVCAQGHRSSKSRAGR